MKQDELSSLPESPSTFPLAATNERAVRERQGRPLRLVPQALLRLRAVRAWAGVLRRRVPDGGGDATSARGQREAPEEPGRSA